MNLFFLGIKRLLSYIHSRSLNCRLLPIGGQCPRVDSVAGMGSTTAEWSRIGDFLRWRRAFSGTRPPTDSSRLEPGVL